MSLTSYRAAPPRVTKCVWPIRPTRRPDKQGRSSPSGPCWPYSTKIRCGKHALEIFLDCTRARVVSGRKFLPRSHFAAPWPGRALPATPNAINPGRRPIRRGRGPFPDLQVMSLTSYRAAPPRVTKCVWPIQPSPRPDKQGRSSPSGPCWPYSTKIRCGKHALEIFLDCTGARVV